MDGLVRQPARRLIGLNSWRGAWVGIESIELVKGRGFDVGWAAADGDARAMDTTILVDRALEIRGATLGASKHCGERPRGQKYLCKRRTGLWVE